MVVEVCANSLSSVLIAQEAGANRVELCQNLWCGGTTPSAATIEWTRQYLTIDLFVLVRPRSGDFCYTELEFQVMQRDILFCKENGINGIVTGILTPDGAIDTARMLLLQRLAHPMQVTFHRAFDFVQQPFRALNQLIDMGINRVLSSGFKSSAIDGQKNIKALLEAAQEQIAILAGGGLNTDNIRDFVDYTGVQEIHLSGKHLVQSPFHAPLVQLNNEGIPELDYLETNPDTIKKIVEILAEK